MVAFWLRQLSLFQGLLFHPYQTMQTVIERRAYFWVAASPSILWLVLKGLWMFLVVPLVRFFYRCTPNNLLCSGLEFGADWITLFCLYWQILLAYLFIRFYWLLRPH